MLLSLQISIDDTDNWVYGAYTCLAKNVVGSESDSVQLTEAGSYIFDLLH
jgi:hypothetical protein